jgi:hypothetical protein
MNTANVSAGTAKLEHAIKTLRVHWDATKDDWNDQVRQNFEEKHLAPMETRVQAASRGMDQLALVLAQMIRDVGD